VIEWPYDIDGFPVVMFHFNPLPDETYPLSDVAMAEPQVIELMKIYAIEVNHLKRWNRQIFAREGFMTELEKEKFKLGVDGAIINVQGKVNEDFYIPPYAPVQQDVYGVWNQTMDIMRNVWGQSEADRNGNASSNTRTLGELRMQQQGGRSRSDERLDMLEDQINELAKKLLAIMRQKLTLPRIVRMVGQRVVDQAQEKAAAFSPVPQIGQPQQPPMPQQNAPSLSEAIAQRPSKDEPNSMTGSQMFTATGKDIPDQLDVDTVAGSTIPLNKENKLRIIGDFMNTGQFFGIVPASKAARELGKYLLREIDVKELDRVMDIAEQEAQAAQNQPPPQKPGDQEKLMSKQIGLESEKLRHASTVAQAQATMTQAQVQKELAEAKIREQVLKHMLETHRAQLGMTNGKV
jgi:hypothetical protein